MRLEDINKYQYGSINSLNNKKQRETIEIENLMKRYNLEIFDHENQPKAKPYLPLISRAKNQSNMNTEPAGENNEDLFDKIEGKRLSLNDHYLKVRSQKQGKKNGGPKRHTVISNNKDLLNIFAQIREG